MTFFYIMSGFFILSQLKTTGIRRTITADSPNVHMGNRQPQTGYYWHRPSMLLPNSCHWSLSIPPECSRKPEVFCFQGGQKETSGMKWVDHRHILGGYDLLQSRIICTVKTLFSGQIYTINITYLTFFF